MEEIDLSTLLCEKIDSKRIIDFLRCFSGEPIIKNHDDTYYYNYPQCGISFYFTTEDDLLGAIFMYSAGYDDYEQYQGKMPKELQFNFDRSHIHRLLGKPARSGGNEYVAELKKTIALWDRYEYDTHILNITYTTNSTIALVCLDQDC